MKSNDTDDDKEIEYEIEMRAVSVFADGKRRCVTCLREEDSENEELKQLKQQFKAIRRYSIYLSKLLDKYQEDFMQIPDEMRLEIEKEIDEENN